MATGTVKSLVSTLNSNLTYHKETPTVSSSSITIEDKETAVEKNGNTVTITFRFATTAQIAAESALLGIPQGYRPKITKRFSCLAWGENNSYLFTVQPDGIFKVSSNVPSGKIFIAFVTYVI